MRKNMDDKEIKTNDETKVIDTSNIREKELDKKIKAQHNNGTKPSKLDEVDFNDDDEIKVLPSTVEKAKPNKIIKKKELGGIDKKVVTKKIARRTEVKPNEKSNETPSKLGKNKGQATKGLPKKKKKGKKPWIIALIVLAFLIIVACVGVFTLYQSNYTDISDYQYVTKEKTQIFSADNVMIAELFTQNRTYITLDQVPQDLKNALVATEDSRFYNHNGVDYLGFVRALFVNVLNSNSTGEGASTITMQLSRMLHLDDIYLEETFMDSLNRKMQEISIAFQMEEKYTKDQIMEMYLNEYYFGSSAYGIEEAAKTYFGKSVSEINLAESAMLAGLPQAPSAYAPNVDFEAAKNRQLEVLDRMVAEEMITQEQADEAYATEIVIVPWSPEDLDNQIVAGYGAFVNHVLQEYALYEAPRVMKEQGLSEEDAITFIRGNIAAGGYKIYTTINTGYQTLAEENIVNGLNYRGYGPEYTGALVSVNLDGAVLSYYAGNTEIDMVDSPRQPGSNIKPLYYSGALEQGIFTTRSILKDEKTVFGGGWTPQNTGNSYSGNISFTQSLVQSKNITSVKVYEAMGIDNAISWMQSMGITTFVEDDYHLATSLGGMTYGIKPIDMAAAFNVFNNSGVYNEPYTIVEIQKTNGDVVINKDQMELESRQVMSPETAEMMWGILRQVVTSGTGGSAGTYLPTAGKTGTTDNEVDLWFTGMTSTLTTAVWTGSLDNYRIGAGSYMPAGFYGNYVTDLLNEGLLVAED